MAAAPDPTRDTTGSAHTLSDELIELAGTHAAKAARSLPSSTSNYSRNQVVDTAIIKGEMYEFLLKVLTRVEADLEEN